MRTRKYCWKLTPQKGMSLIELMFAGLVTVVGLLGAFTLVFISITNNSRNKGDTSSTLIAQMVIEHIAALPANDPATSLSITDCAATPNTWTIAVTDPGSNHGSKALASGKSIDFSEAYSAAPNNYKMLYVACDNGVYDVRWNIQALAGTITRMVIVSVRPRGSNDTSGNTKNILIFAQPVTLRTITGA